MTIKRIVLSGGGTGGHVYPGLSVYQELKRRYPELECLFIGTAKGLESEILKQHPDIQFKTIEISGFKRKLTLSNFKVIFQMLNSTHKAKKMIRDFNPDVVIGTGGFVCGPVLWAATQLKFPALIHEQNSVAGVTNKFLASKVDKIATSFKEVHRDFAQYPQKIVYTGNPRGQEVLDKVSEADSLTSQFGLDPDVATVLIFGGSRGAPAINRAAIESVEAYASAPYQVIIGTGKVHYDEWIQYLAERKVTVPANVKIINYIDQMPSLMNQIDLIVSRSGATTLAEITALGLPSILIPSPYVTNNHQVKNALALVNQQAAVMIEEKDLTAQTLKEQIDELMASPSQLKQMSEKAKNLGKPDAIDALVVEIEKLVK